MNNILKKYSAYFLLSLAILCITGCTGYKFTFSGVNIDPKVKSISVALFYNDASDGPPNLAVLLTESLRDYYQRNTPLDVTTTDGDLQISGTIKSYRTAPVGGASQGEIGTEFADQQRLTVTVSIDFINIYDESKDFAARSFSGQADFDADKTLTDVEQQLLEEIFDEQIIPTIFNKTVADW